MSVLPSHPLSEVLKAEQQQGKATKNIVVLDGMRGFATLAVITFHLHQMVGNTLWDHWQFPILSALWIFGDSGVMLFFVLSGFLLFMPYAKALLFAERWPSVWQFYKRRALRILPGYYVALFLIVLLFQRRYLQPEHWGELGLFIVFLMDSVPATFRRLNGPFWTLAVEWQFYMVLPWLALGFLFVARKIVIPQRRLWVMSLCCMAVILYGLLIRHVGLYVGTHPAPAIVYGMLFFMYGIIGKYVETFALGMLVCLFYVYAHHPMHGIMLRERLRRWSFRFGLAGMFILLFAAVWRSQKVPLIHTSSSLYELLSEMVVAIGYALCMAATLFGAPMWQKVFSWRPLSLVGLISFGLYMWHLPLLIFFHARVLSLLPPLNTYVSYLVHWLWIVAVIVPVAIASYILVERPFIKRK